jgi:hypothetical protein
MPLNVAEAVLPVVDGLTLPALHRELLRPGELVRAADGEIHRLPRYFYEVDTWAVALTTQLSPNFGLWEFMDVDLRERSPLRLFPRYVPCAVGVLAAALEGVRLDVGAPVRIAANGGYRSPSHGSGFGAGSPHCWAAAADIYRIGTDLLDAPDRLERYAAVTRRALPFAWIRPGVGEAGPWDDHLHVDLGYVTVVPRGQSEHDHETAGRDEAR